jgi:hypothetical protein
MNEAIKRSTSPSTMPTATHRCQRCTTHGAFVARAEKDVAPQISRAGVRLAAVLNKSLGKQVAGER